MQVETPDIPRFSALESFNGLSHADTDTRGAVFTRREVVDFILDLVGYTPDKPLHKMRLLEPCIGIGDFLIPAVERLFDSLSPKSSRDHANLAEAILAVEIHHASFLDTREKLLALLASRGVTLSVANFLTKKWLIHGDFLLTELSQKFTHVVGNPPYVRHEMIPPQLINEYRTRFRTIYDRADLYIPFIEKSLESLTDDGGLCFICSDRWMKNKYGAPLRAFVSERFHLSAYVDMVNTDAFDTQVIAYPAITLLHRKTGKFTKVAHRPAIAAKTLASLSSGLLGRGKHSAVTSVQGVVNGSAPWMLQSFDQVAIVRRLENEFPLLEEVGCKVGIGVATGADKIFVGDFKGLPVESDRKIPLVCTGDIISGKVKWLGRGVVNPFREDGKLVDLNDYPLLKLYLEEHGDLVRARHCAKKNGAWYRTIDRITPSLTCRPKLLIPDIKGDAHVVYEKGNFYPHHNLYFITSERWHLHALQAVLSSGIAKLFVATYSVQMAGGFLRFQAQYLRRIRIPSWDDVPKEIQEALIVAGKQQDRQLADELVCQLYHFTPKEQRALVNYRK